MAESTRFVKMAVQRQWQLLTSSNLLINRLVTTQLCHKCGLVRSEEVPGLPKEAQELYCMPRYRTPASISASWTCSLICVN